MRKPAQWTSVLAVVFLAGAVSSYVALPYLAGQAPGAAPVTTPFPKELGSYRDVVKKILPAVVSIESRIKPKAVKENAPQRRALPEGAQVPEEFRKFFGGMEQFEMPDQPVQGFGSGFIVDPKGVILTNYHVVAGADQVEVQLTDGRKFTSKDIKTDQKTDLAIVRIDAKGPLPYMELGDSDVMEIGDRVLAVGAPFGLTGSVTAGIVSAKGRNGLSMNMYEDFFQTDAAINPGNSGGPLVNLEGKVIGINSAIKTKTGGFQGVGLAIASNLARNVMTQLLKDGTVHRGYLGVQIKDLVDKDVMTRLGVKDHGVLVTQVFDKAPAAKGGMQAGDVITSITGKPVKDGRELQRIVATLPLGKPVEMIVVRDGKTQTLQVTVEEQPEDFGTARVPVPRSSKRGEENSVNLGKIGVEVADLTPETADQLGYKDGVKGAVITGVDRGSLADQGGLRRGMLIVKADKEPVKSAAGLKEAVDKGSLDKGVLLQVQTPQGGTNFVMLKSEDEAK